MFASNIFVFFFGSFLSVFSIHVTDASIRKPLWHSLQKCLCKYSCMQDFSVKLSSITFILIPSIAKLICSFTLVLFIALFPGHKINKTLIVTVQTTLNRKLSPVAVLLNIIMSVTLLQSSHRRLSELTFLCNGYNCSACVHFKMRP